MYYVYVVHTGSVAISYDVLLVNAKIKKKICDHIRGSGAISYYVMVDSRVIFCKPDSRKTGTI